MQGRSSRLEGPTTCFCNLVVTCCERDGNTVRPTTRCCKRDDDTAKSNVCCCTSKETPMLQKWSALLQTSHMEAKRVARCFRKPHTQHFKAESAILQGNTLVLKRLITGCVLTTLTTSRLSFVCAVSSIPAPTHTHMSVLQHGLCCKTIERYTGLRTN